jgi:phosphoribosylformylglycinamidine synthase subunit PurL
MTIHRALGLTDDEAAHISEILGRSPNHLELAMYAVMWSEHCSYKSSRMHLKRLPTEAPWVLVGPGENAGVIDVGDGIAAAIRIESHNHPSAIEPGQGAATGVGGILRDIFTMGARPIALMDPLRFGPLEHARSKWIAEGVVSGISHYGNAVGVPTVGGEVVFDSCYMGNPLVNVLCLGILPTERLVLGAATGVGNLAVLLGSATGRDGIGGVSVLASAGFTEDQEAEAAKRPNVQVGDPFEEKRLIEACLALLDAALVVGIQDLGGAGLTCATSETASRGHMGMDVDVDAVPRREPGMEPFEVMTSESQERMLAIVTPESVEEVLAICTRWDVRATVIGKVTEGGRLRIMHGFDGDVVADVPASSLHEDAPLYDRPMAPRQRREREPRPVRDAASALLSMLGDMSWVFSQYDHMLFNNTVVGPGAEATVLRLKHPTTGIDTGRALALTTDGNHRWCAIDPREGTTRVVAEAVMNLACVGARPQALVNCLNFGNPEHPEVMWELSEAIDGMAAACRAFELPVVGGNVSLYNETAGADIDPTPIVGVLGVIDSLERRPPFGGLVEGHELVLVGPMPADGLVGSRVAWATGDKGGAFTALDLAMHAQVADVVRSLVNGEQLSAIHDVADGGLALAIAELAARGRCGAVLDSGATAAGDEGLDTLGDAEAVTWTAVAIFAESPSQVLVATPDADEVIARAHAGGVAAVRVGWSGGRRLVIGTVIDLDMDTVVDRWTNALPEAFGRAVSH